MRTCRVVSWNDRKGRAAARARSAEIALRGIVAGLVGLFPCMSRIDHAAAWAI